MANLRKHSRMPVDDAIRYLTEVVPRRSIDVRVRDTITAFARGDITLGQLSDTLRDIDEPIHDYITPILSIAEALGWDYRLTDARDMKHKSGAWSARTRSYAIGDAPYSVVESDLITMLQTAGLDKHASRHKAKHVLRHASSEISLKDLVH